MNRKRNRKDQDTAQNTYPITGQQEGGKEKRYIKDPDEIITLIATIMMTICNVLIFRLYINELKDDD